MDPFFKKILRYQYPSKEELTEIEDRSPMLRRFGFIDQWNNKLIKDNLINGSNEKYNKLSHLYEWDKLLKNKIGDLQTAYVYVLVHFNRGVPRTAQEYIENTDSRPNYDNLRFYFIYLHYIVISVVDNILQILNVYFDIELPENKVYRCKVVKKLGERGIQTVADIINTFYNDFEKYTDSRNTLAHRYSPYNIDR